MVLLTLRKTSRPMVVFCVHSNSSFGKTRCHELQNPVRCDSSYRYDTDIPPLSQSINPNQSRTQLLDRRKMLLRRFQQHPSSAARHGATLAALRKPARMMALQHHPQYLQHLQQQTIGQRLLWNKSSGFMSWLGFNKEDEKSKPRSSHAPSAPQEAVPQPPHAARETSEPNMVSRTAVPASGIEIDIDASSKNHVKKALLEFTRYIYTANDNARLMAMWRSIHDYQPFFIQDQRVHLWDPESIVGVSSPDGEGTDAVRTPQIMQLIPIETYVELAKKAQSLEIGSPSCFVGNATGNADNSVSPQNVLYLSEKNVIRQLVRAMARSADIAHKADVAQLLEQYEVDREHKINELLAAASSTGGDIEVERETLENWTRLSKDTHAAYIDVLGDISDHKKIIAVFEEPGNISKYLGSYQTLRKTLKACLVENRGDLARTVVDEFPVHFPWLVLGKNSYQMAIQASFKSRHRTAEQLQDALHIYRRMSKDAEYILYPNIWSTIFNSCIYLKCHEEAVELFGTYAAQRIAPFQQRFTQALRTACKFEQYDTAIAMVLKWVDLEKRAYESKSKPSSGSASILENQSTKPKPYRAHRPEIECFNKVLWEMLKGEPRLDQLEQVLEVMQGRLAPAGAQVIRRLVSRYLRTANCSVNADKEPVELVEAFLKLWERVPNVIERNGFVLHLVIEHCLAEKWDDGCALLIDYGVANKINLPMGSVVKIMESYETKGLFDKVVSLGGKLLRDPSESELSRLSQGFFEVYLMSCLRQQKFVEIEKLNNELGLTERFPRSEVLAVIVRDAASV